MSDSDPKGVTPEQVDEVLDEFGGDARKAIAALLHDLQMMASDYEGSVSRGYVRGIATDAPYRRRRMRG